MKVTNPSSKILRLSLAPIGNNLFVIPLVKVFNSSRGINLNWIVDQHYSL